MTAPQVLIVTNKYDVHADHLVPMLEERGVGVVRLNTEDLLTHYRIWWQPNGCGELRGPHHQLNLVNVGAVWYRKPNDYNLAPEWCGFEEFLREELRATMGGIYRTLSSARWINPLDAQRRASYKLVQLQTAADVGLSIPDTLVTNDPERAREFAGKHASRGIAAKTLGAGLVHLPPGQTIFTNRLRADQLDDATQLSCFPHFLQSYVEKDVELRVTVVGDRLFVCEIDTQASPSDGARIDWRRYDFEYVAYKPGVLPASIQSKLFRLMHNLGLVFAAIDMIRTPSGDHVFLEVNPAGQWLWVEQRTQLPISAAIVDLLACDQSAKNQQNIVSQTPIQSHQLRDHP
jgi:glutathione synthase/RimK-type ligase-like ATP-grasp enzyme